MREIPPELVATKVQLKDGFFPFALSHSGVSRVMLSSPTKQFWFRDLKGENATPRMRTSALSSQTLQAMDGR
jgi:hypothetical protein